MKCQIGKAIEKIDKLISSSSKVDNNIKKQLAEVKIKLNSARDIKMAKMKSNTSGSKSKTPEFDKLPSYAEGQKTMTYAGIGSSTITPIEVQIEMNKIAKILNDSGYTLQSGGAVGADKAFEGAPQPWKKEDGTKAGDKNFKKSEANVTKDGWSTYAKHNIKKSIFKATDANERTLKIAKELHPNWSALTAKGDYGAKLMARNTNQVFGKNLDTPVDFVLFYAKEQKDSIRPEGGTGQAVEMARLKGIPTINMADKNWREQLNKVLNKNKTKEAQEIEKKTSEPEVEYQKGNSNEYYSKLDTKIANKLKNIYKDIEVIYLNGQNEMRSMLNELGGNIAMFQLSKKRKDEFEKKLRKARPELDGTSIDNILDSIEEFSETESNGNEKLMKKLELLALHWTIKGNVILPEDGGKILDALRIADKNKFDPFSYNNPNEITESFAKVEEKTKPLNPDDYIGKGYSNRRELAEGVVVYDVDNNDTGREVSRAMIDTHFGKDANPWCLLAKKDGGIEFSSTYWYKTYPGKKKIAFHNGKLVTFYGGDKWWDRLDNPNSDITITKSGSFIEGESTVKARFLVSEELKEAKPYSPPFGMDSASQVVYEKGENKLGKSYHGWNKDKVKVIEISPEGSITEWYSNGKIKEEKVKKQGSDGFSRKLYYESGSIMKYEPDGFLGESTSYYENGSIKDIYKPITNEKGYKFLTIEYSKDGYLSKAVYPNDVRVSNTQIGILGDSSNINNDGVKVVIQPKAKLSGNPFVSKQEIHKDGTFTYYYDKYNNDKEFLVERVVEPDGTETLYDKKGRITKVTDSEGNVITHEYKDGIVAKVMDFIGFQEENDVIKGAAIINEKKILIDIENRSTDTLAHEYAHFYIAAFRDIPIVQEAINKFGGEEALVQAIGEQTVKQKGEVYNWWKQFSALIRDMVSALDKASKEELVQLLTDAFLTNKNLNEYNPQSEPGGVDKNKYEIISKDDIEAAKDIMSNNKKECE